MTSTPGTHSIGERLAAHHQQRATERAAAQAAVQPEQPADRQPGIEAFRALQAQVDGAHTALSEALREGAMKSVIADREQKLAIAKENVSRAVDAAPDPMAARALAAFTANEQDRPTRPITAGDMILEAASVSRGRERYLENQVKVMGDWEQFRDERDHPERQAAANRELLIGQLQALREAKAEANPEAPAEA
ncbi:hypothetical protein H4696_008459 [Amycolatopsis lexingtonensis]|uniref:Uncharacterized protein n=1 Tax=Amycolatopsis lexingtonensis TaxID=218822 RepID=A0ABR9IDX0_9PSEU|nr:hypothetical protein [Amycolatopsis lexingtonensis]MBE1501359.1 hypothetical protein [Amycolatopsis lexingtonensis]